MSKESSVKYQDGSWHWVCYEGLHEVYEAPAMYKANCDAWYSFQFSGMPTRHVEVLGPCERPGLAVAMPDGQLLGDALLMWNRRHDNPPIKVGFEHGVADALLQVMAIPAVRAEQVQLSPSHRAMVNNAIRLLLLRRPAAPDVERVAADLQIMLDGHEAPAPAPGAEWLEVAEKAGEGRRITAKLPDVSELQRVIYSADAAAKRMLDADSFWWSEIASIRVEFERFMRASLQEKDGRP